MSTRWLAVSIALLAAAAAQPAFAEDARARGASGGGSSSAGEHHHSSSSGSSSSSSSSHGSSSSSHYSAPSSSSSSSSSPVLTDAQRRHPRAGTGTGYNGSYGRSGYHYGGSYGGGYRYGGGYGYRPYYSGYGYYPWGGLYFDSYWGSSPYYYGGYYGRGSYGGGYYTRSYRDTGSVRVLVDQHNANVFVDGYYAGIVDDFDGIFQRLYVAPGHHAITVKLGGYQTHTFDVYVPYDGTLKLHWEMVRGSGDDGSGDPTLNAATRRDPRDDRDGRYDRGVRDDRDRRDNGDRYEQNQADRDDDNAVDDRYAPNDENRGPRGRSSESGSLHLSVRPDDASIYVDGAFRGTARELADLDLASGPHRLEIVRPGYRTVERDVTVEGGRSVDLDVSLER